MMKALHRKRGEGNEVGTRLPNTEGTSVAESGTEAHGSPITLHRQYRDFRLVSTTETYSYIRSQLWDLSTKS